MEHLTLNYGGNWSVVFNGIFDEPFLPFPDLTQEAAAVDDENLCVDDDKATLEVEAETSGEMYVSGNDFCSNFNNDMSS